MKITVNGQSDYCLTDERTPIFFLYKSADMRMDYLLVEVNDEKGVCFWKSEKFSFSPQICYGGAPLLPKRVYTVSVFGYRKDILIDSAQFLLETGFMGTAWEGAWIEPLQDSGIREKEINFHKLFIPNPELFGGHVRLRPCLEVKKTFFLEEPPAFASMYVSAHGIYTLNVNHAKVSGRLFAPETSSYQKRLYYQKYDLYSNLKKGKNEILITLADGWWIGRIGISGDSCQYGNTLGCIVQLDIITESGVSITIASDESFLGRRSRIDYADLFIGQRTDFLREEDSWSPCSVAFFKNDNLIAQPISPIVEYDRLPPQLTQNRKGELIADFKKVIAGVPDITVKCEPGREVTLDFCEVLDGEGGFLRNILGRNKDQRDSFVCGYGVTRFTPEFTYHGFRYMRIIGVREDEIIDLSARVLGTELATRGGFSCSEASLNQLQENICNSARSNFFSVPTDCPQREKAGWTGDVVAFASSGCFTYHLDGFLRSWLENMKVEQFDDGGIPVVIPNYPMQEKHQKGIGGSTSSVWSDAAVLVPWQLYQSYGDLEVLRSCLPMMERWITKTIAQCNEQPEDFVFRTEQEQKWNSYLMNTGFHFGDWFIPSFQRAGRNPFEASEITKDVVASAYHAITLDVYLKILILLGEDEKKISFIEDRLEKVRQAVSACYVSPEGVVRGDLQGLYVILLNGGFLKEKSRLKVLNRLVTLIRENGTRLDTGFVSTPLLLGTLTDNGKTNLALELLFQRMAPSWLYMVDRGATSIWENWEAIKPDGSIMPSSFNHYALGSVGDFLYRYIAGIRIEEAGYRRIVFSPLIECGLENAEAQVESAYGVVSCSWKWSEGVCCVTLGIPENCEGSLILFGRQEVLSAGRHRFTITRDRLVLPGDCAGNGEKDEINENR
jgi:alpha-L-rhamnosidase